MADHPYFPLFIDLSGKMVVIIGGGPIAARRAGALEPFGCSVTVIAPEMCPAMEDLIARGGVRAVRREFIEADLAGAAMALSVTGDDETDLFIVKLCRERGIAVNAASDRSACDFYFPGIARNGSMVVGVTASGSDHRKAREVTEKIRSLLEEF